MTQMGADDRGFMLLEVILSIVVIASALVLVIRSYTTSARASQAARMLSRGCLFLEEKVFDIDAKAFIEGVKEEETEGDIDGYKWRISALPIGDEKELNRVDLQVSRGKRAIKVSTYLKYKEG